MSRLRRIRLGENQDGENQESQSTAHHAETGEKARHTAHAARPR
jgi:hypothetical protein